MSAALRLAVEPPSPPSTEESSASIDAWLSRMVEALRLPPAASNDIRLELASHLEERIRDLMVTGLPEHQAAARALAELGEPTVMARRLRAAHLAPRRRTLMNLSLLAVAAAVVSGAVMLRPPQPVVKSAVFEPGSTPATQRADFKVEFSFRGENRWGDLFDAVAKSSGRQPAVHWNSLQELFGGEKLGPDSVISVTVAGATTVDQVFEAINAEIGLRGSDRIEYRDDGTRIEIASSRFFDLRESRLVTYDISELVKRRTGEDNPQANQIDQATEEIAMLIQNIVEKDSWSSNGGDRATLNGYADRLFIRAPRRMLIQVEWVLQQLGDSSAESPDKHRVEGVVDQPRKTSLNVNSPLGATSSFTLNTLPPESARQLLHSVFDAVPSLRQCAVTRVLEVDGSDHRLSITATPRQVDFTTQLLKVIDHDAMQAAQNPAQDSAKDPAQELIPLKHLSVDTLQPVLRSVMKLPAPRQGELTVAADAAQNAIVLAGPAGDLAYAAKIIDLLDRDWTDNPKEATTIEGVRGTRRVPLLSDIPILATAFTTSEPAPLEVRASQGTIRVKSQDGSIIEADAVQIHPANP